MGDKLLRNVGIVLYCSRVPAANAPGCTAPSGVSTRDPSSERREMADEFYLKMPDFPLTFRDLLHAVNLRHGTNGFTSLPREGVLRIFLALKNPTTSAGFEPANLGTKGQHATSRPPKPLKCR